MTQEEFAQALGVTMRAVQNWEAGEAEPRPSSVRKMAELTGRSASWFLDTPEEAVA